jgi:hypothetical protein
VAADWVVEGFDPLEDRRGELVAARPVLPVECCRSSSSRCLVDQNDSIMMLSTELATRPGSAPDSWARSVRLDAVRHGPRQVDCAAQPADGAARSACQLGA